MRIQYPQLFEPRQPLGPVAPTTTTEWWFQPVSQPVTRIRQPQQQSFFFAFQAPPLVALGWLQPMSQPLARVQARQLLPLEFPWPVLGPVAPTTPTLTWFQPISQPVARPRPAQPDAALLVPQAQAAPAATPSAWWMQPTAQPIAARRPQQPASSILPPAVPAVAVWFGLVVAPAARARQAAPAQPAGAIVVALPPAAPSWFDLVVAPLVRRGRAAQQPDGPGVLAPPAPLASTPVAWWELATCPQPFRPPAGLPAYRQPAALVIAFLDFGGTAAGTAVPRGPVPAATPRTGGAVTAGGGSDGPASPR